MAPGAIVGISPVAAGTAAALILLGYAAVHSATDRKRKDPRMTWEKQAACLGQEALFSSWPLPKRANVEAAKQVCSTCPVLAHCRNWLSTDELAKWSPMVVAGTSFRDRHPTLKDVPHAIAAAAARGGM